MTEFSVLSPLRLRLLESLKQHVCMEIGICYEKNRAGVFSIVEPNYQALVGLGFAPVFSTAGRNSVPTLSQIQEQLFQEQPLPVNDTSALQVLLSPGKEKEATVVADKIKQLLLSDERRPDTVAVVVRDIALYPQLRTAFAERGIPLDLPETMAISALALPRLIFSWLDMVRERGSRASVLAVMKSPYVADKLGWKPDEVEKSVLKEVVRNWTDWITAIWRQAPDETVRELWLHGVQTLQEFSESWSAAASWAEWAIKLQELLAWLDAPGSLKCRREADSLDFQLIRAELSAWQAMREAVEQLQCVQDLLQSNAEKVTLGQFGDALRQVLQDRRVPVSESEAEGVQVVTPGTASGIQFSAVFLLGLTEGEFPASPKESWLYGDAERSLLAEAGVLLTTSAERARTEEFYFSLAVAMAKEKLTLSAVIDNENLPSRFMEEVTRLFVEGMVVVEQFGPDQLVPEQVEETWGSRELEKGALAHLWQSSSKEAQWRPVYEVLRLEFPAGLEERAVVEAKRSGKHAGLVRPELVNMAQFSPSALEQYAACPFAFFVSEVLRLSEWEAAEAGMDALAAGSIWHEVLAVFLDRYRGRQLLKAKRDSYAKELSGLLATAVAGREKQGKIVPDVWWKFEKPLYESAMLRWLDMELARQQKWNPYLLFLNGLLACRQVLSVIRHPMKNPLFWGRTACRSVCREKWTASTELERVIE